MQEGTSNGLLDSFFKSRLLVLQKVNFGCELIQHLMKRPHDDMSQAKPFSQRRVDLFFTHTYTLTSGKACVCVCIHGERSASLGYSRRDVCVYVSKRLLFVVLNGAATCHAESYIMFSSST